MYKRIVRYFSNKIQLKNIVFNTKTLSQLRKSDMNIKHGCITHCFHMTYKPDPPMRGSCSCMRFLKLRSIGKLRTYLSMYFFIYVNYSFDSTGSEYHSTDGCHGK